MSGWLRDFIGQHRHPVFLALREDHGEWQHGQRIGFGKDTSDISTKYLIY
ncbi:hypothetical protein [Mesorhizobium sp. M7A.F.Ca.US.006.01.1.1]|nr:hypothetical protein [Mesorhizobium sp. M7A.F.Ca.US.006.01.1.1]